MLPGSVYINPEATMTLPLTHPTPLPPRVRTSCSVPTYLPSTPFLFTLPLPCFLHSHKHTSLVRSRSHSSDLARVCSFELKLKHIQPLMASLVTPR